MSSVEETKDETKILDPDYTVRYQTIGKDDHFHTFAQRPLSFFGKMELFSLLGATVNTAIKEGDFSPGEFFADASENLLDDDSDIFVKAIVQLIEFAPDLLKDIYCLALAVPKGERDYIKALMELPHEEGGLSDDDGIAILDTLIEQNWEAIQDFFVLKMMPLFQKVSSKVQATASSKPSKATPRRTRKQ